MCAQNIALHIDTLLFCQGAPACCGGTPTKTGSSGSSRGNRLLFCHVFVLLSSIRRPRLAPDVVRAILIQMYCAPLDTLSLMASL